MQRLKDFKRKIFRETVRKHVCDQEKSKIQEKKKEKTLLTKKKGSIKKKRN